MVISTFMTKYSYRSHHARCMRPKEGLRSYITAVSSVLVRFSLFELIIDGVVSNE